MKKCYILFLYNLCLYGMSIDDYVISIPKNQKNVLNLWYQLTGENCLKVEHKQDIKSISISDKANLIASGDCCGELKVHDICSGSILVSINLPSYLITKIIFGSNDSLVIVACFNKVFVIDINNCSIKQEIICLDTINHMCLYNNSQLITLSEDKSIKVWDLESGDMSLGIKLYEINNKVIDISAIKTDKIPVIKICSDSKIYFFCMISGERLEIDYKDTYVKKKSCHLDIYDYKDYTVKIWPDFYKLSFPKIKK